MLRGLCSSGIHIRDCRRKRRCRKHWLLQPISVSRSELMRGRRTPKESRWNASGALLFWHSHTRLQKKAAVSQALATTADLGLSQRADARKANAEGKPVECFGGSALLAFTYATAEESGGVASIGYYSRSRSLAAS